MFGKLFWCASKDKVAPIATAFGSHVDDPVGNFDNIVVMFNDDDGVTTGYEAVE